MPCVGFAIELTYPLRMVPPNRPRQHERMYATLALAGFSALAAAYGPLTAIYAPDSPGWMARLAAFAGIVGIAIVLLLLTTKRRPPTTGHTLDGSAGN